MRKVLAITTAALIVFALSACQFFDSPGYYAADGTYYPPEKGVFTVLSEGASAAGAAGVPWAGAAGGLLGLIGGIGAFLADKGRKKNLAGMVELLDRLKPQIHAITNEEQLEAFILRVAPEDTKFGAALKAMWKRMQTKD